jgi:Domain of unknown function (DUF4136)
MRTANSRLALSILAICAVSTIAVCQEVSVNYNHNADFSKFHTYAWGSRNANPIQDLTLAQVARQSINSAMQSKGLQLVQEAQNPDLILNASGGVKDQTSYGGITPEENIEGTIVVDLYDTRSQSLVWRGVARSLLTNRGNQETVEKAVDKMFKKWPK